MNVTAVITHVLKRVKTNRNSLHTLIRDITILLDEIRDCILVDYIFLDDRTWDDLLHEIRKVEDGPCSIYKIQIHHNVFLASRILLKRIEHDLNDDLGLCVVDVSCNPPQVQESCYENNHGIRDNISDILEGNRVLTPSPSCSLTVLCGYLLGYPVQYFVGAEGSSCLSEMPITVFEWKGKLKHDDTMSTCVQFSVPTQLLDAAPVKESLSNFLEKCRNDCSISTNVFMSQRVDSEDKSEQNIVL